VTGSASVGRATAVFVLLSVIEPVATAAPVPDVGWSAYGGDAGGARYSTAAQITPANVDRLEVAWTFRTGELGQGVKDWSRSAFEATPILHDGTLYLTTSSTDVVAVNAVTGQLRWRHASRSRDDLHYSDGVSRGVSLWVDPSSPPDAVCHARIFAPTLDGRLLALDAATGKPCVEFGTNGAVNLLLGVRSQFKKGDEWRDYLVTSGLSRHLAPGGPRRQGHRRFLHRRQPRSARGARHRTGLRCPQWPPGLELGSDPARCLESGLQRMEPREHCERQCRQRLGAAVGGCRAPARVRAHGFGEPGLLRRPATRR